MCGRMLRMAAVETGGQSAECDFGSSQLVAVFVIISGFSRWRCSDCVHCPVPVDRQEPRVDLKPLADGSRTTVTNSNLLRCHSTANGRYVSVPCCGCGLRWKQSTESKFGEGVHDECSYRTTYRRSAAGARHRGGPSTVQLGDIHRLAGLTNVHPYN